MFNLKQYRTHSIFVILATLTPALASAQSLSPIQQKVAEVMQGEHRTPEERARDADRDPVAAVEFMGIEDDMTLVEFLPAGQAYYTKILGPIINDNGHLMVVDTQGTFDRWGDWKDQAEFSMTHPVAIDNQYNRSLGRYEIGDIEFGLPAGSADKFLYIREYHNYNAEDNARINAAVLEVLKPGGEYVIIDHTRRHMEPEDNENYRREDPVSVIYQVLQAGFELDRITDMFAQPTDDLSQEVGKIPNMTDRFFLVFKKPE